MLLNILTLALGLNLAHAGGVQCQINGTCECQANGTCDKFGNPIGPRAAAGAENIVQCGTGDEAFRVILDRSVSELPASGSVPARFENLALTLRKEVEASVNPVFHTRGIRFGTAYCSYSVQFDSADGARYYVLSAHSVCEGASRELRCELN